MKKKPLEEARPMMSHGPPPALLFLLSSVIGLTLVLMVRRSDWVALAFYGALLTYACVVSASSTR